MNIKKLAAGALAATAVVLAAPTVAQAAPVEHWELCFRTGCVDETALLRP